MSILYGYCSQRVLLNFNYDCNYNSIDGNMPTYVRIEENTTVAIGLFCKAEVCVWDHNGHRGLGYFLFLPFFLYDTFKISTQTIRKCATTHTHIIWPLVYLPITRDPVPLNSRLLGNPNHGSDWLHNSMAIWVNREDAGYSSCPHEEY